MAEQPIFQNEAAVIDLTRETQYAANGIVSRTVFQQQGVRQVLFGFGAGQELTEHVTTRHALVQVLQGWCDFQVGPDTHRMQAGQMLYLPPGTPHAVRATEPFAMLLTLVPVG